MLTGLCNQCGLCCQIGEYQCMYLVVADGLKIGDPAATFCAAYARRYDRMPIVMFNGDGTKFFPTVCATGSQAEEDGIVERGIGKGCSLVRES